MAKDIKDIGSLRFWGLKNDRGRWIGFDFKSSTYSGQAAMALVYMDESNARRKARELKADGKNYRVVELMLVERTKKKVKR